MTDAFQLTCEDLELIRNLAYVKYIERGGENGHDLEDWLAAEQEIRGCNPAAADGSAACSTVETPSEMVACV